MGHMESGPQAPDCSSHQLQRSMGSRDIHYFAAVPEDNMYVPFSTPELILDVKRISRTRQLLFSYPTRLHHYSIYTHCDICMDFFDHLRGRYVRFTVHHYLHIADYYIAILALTLVKGYKHCTASYLSPKVIHLTSTSDSPAGFIPLNEPAVP